MQWSTWGSVHISDSGRGSEIKISQQSSDSDGHQGQQTTSRGSMSVCIKAGANLATGKNKKQQSTGGNGNKVSKCTKHDRNSKQQQCFAVAAVTAK